MKAHFLTATTLVLMIGLSTTSNAAIIDASDSSYLTDTATNLDWLDVTASVNQSYNYVSSQFGSGNAYDGWRYATADEFNVLVSNYTGVPIPVGTYTQVAHATDLSGLVDLFGVTDVAGGSPTRRVTQGMIDKLYYGDQRAAVLFDYVLNGVSTSYPDISNTDQYIYKQDDAVSNLGSFLVRIAGRAGTGEAGGGGYEDGGGEGGRAGMCSVGEQCNVPEVPIPAAAFMFAPALLGFLGLRRRAKNNVA